MSQPQLVTHRDRSLTCARFPAPFSVHPSVCVVAGHRMRCVVPTADVAVVVHDPVQLESGAGRTGRTHEVLQSLQLGQ